MSDTIVVGDPSGPALQCLLQAIHPYRSRHAMLGLLEDRGLAPVPVPVDSRLGRWHVYGRWLVELDAPSFDALVALRLDPRDHLACGRGLRASRPDVPVAAWVGVQREWRRHAHAPHGIAVAPFVGLSWDGDSPAGVYGGAASWMPGDRNVAVELIVGSRAGDPVAEIVGGWRRPTQANDGRRWPLQPGLWLGVGVGGGVSVVGAAEVGVWLPTTGVRLRLRPEATWGTGGWTVGGALLVDFAWVVFP